MHSLQDALVGIGLAAPLPPSPPKTSYETATEAAAQRLSAVSDFMEFCRRSRDELGRWPTLIDSEIHRQAARFSEHPDYPKLIAWLDEVKAEMARPEFDFTSGRRMRHWLMYTLMHAMKKKSPPAVSE